MNHEIQSEADEVVTDHVKCRLKSAIAQIDSLRLRIDEAPLSALVIAAKTANSWVDFIHTDEEDYDKDKFRVFSCRGINHIIQGKEVNTDPDNR